MARPSRNLALVVFVDASGLEKVTDGGAGDADAAADLDARKAWRGLRWLATGGRACRPRCG
ncbi:MAG: hypothetical protein WBA45_01975 [Microthrixaceae bacterium]